MSESLLLLFNINRKTKQSFENQTPVDRQILKTKAFSDTHELLLVYASIFKDLKGKIWYHLVVNKLYYKQINHWKCIINISLTLLHYCFTYPQIVTKAISFLDAYACFLLSYIFTASTKQKWEGGSLTDQTYSMSCQQNSVNVNHLQVKKKKKKYTTV